MHVTWQLVVPQNLSTKPEDEPYVALINEALEILNGGTNSYTAYNHELGRCAMLVPPGPGRPRPQIMLGMVVAASDPMIDLLSRLTNTSPTASVHVIGRALDLVEVA